VAALQQIVVVTASTVVVFALKSNAHHIMSPSPFAIRHGRGRHTVGILNK
jgi:hypothetical protein